MKYSYCCLKRAKTEIISFDSPDIFKELHLRTNFHQPITPVLSSCSKNEYTYLGLSCIFVTEFSISV